MSLKITEHPNVAGLVLLPPRFLCDKPLVKREIAPFENKTFFTTYVGCAGGGKTSTAIACLTNKKIYRKAFTSVFVIMPPTSRASLARDPFKFLKKSNMYPELTYAALHDIYEKITESSSDDEADGDKAQYLLVLDDVTQSLKDPVIQRTLQNLILNRRHHRLSIMLLVQYWNSLPLPLRKSVSSVVLCNRPTNKSESDNIMDEVMHLDRKKAEAVINFAFKKRYDKLFIQLQPLLFYRNMNRLSFDDAT